MNVRLAICLSLALALAWGCSSIDVSHIQEPGTDFSRLKTFNWSPVSPLMQKDPLVSQKIKYSTEDYLESQGLELSQESPDMLIAFEYEFDIAGEKAYDLRSLNFTVLEGQTRKILWRGTAAGVIGTDDESDDIRNAVEDIFESFPFLGKKAAETESPPGSILLPSGTY